MDSRLLAVVVIGGSTLLSVIGLLLVRRRFGVDQIKSHHEVAGYMLSILGTLYAVVLGFMVVDVSNHVQEERVNLGSEINALVNIFRLSEGLKEKVAVPIQSACIQYAQAVCDDEWDLMPRGILCASTFRLMKTIWSDIKQVVPETEQEKAYFSQILQNYDAMSASRRIRLVTAAGTVSPVLWVVLIFGAMATIGFTYFFTLEKLSSQILMTAIVSVTLSMNIYLVVINATPFTGTFRIRSAPFQAAVRIMKDRSDVPPDVHDLR
ncbi:MAG TPA: hypothetical protein V6C72_14650 [Chroococcales cyanobacterium]